MPLRLADRDLASLAMVGRFSRLAAWGHQLLAGNSTEVIASWKSASRRSAVLVRSGAVAHLWASAAVTAAATAPGVAGTVGERRLSVVVNPWTAGSFASQLRDVIELLCNADHLATALRRLLEITTTAAKRTEAVMQEMQGLAVILAQFTYGTTQDKLSQDDEGAGGKEAGGGAGSSRRSMTRSLSPMRGHDGGGGGGGAGNGHGAGNGDTDDHERRREDMSDVQVLVLAAYAGIVANSAAGGGEEKVKRTEATEATEATETKGTPARRGLVFEEKNTMDTTPHTGGTNGPAPSLRGRVRNKVQSGNVGARTRQDAARSGLVGGAFCRARPRAQLTGTGGGGRGQRGAAAGRVVGGGLGAKCRGTQRRVKPALPPVTVQPRRCRASTCR